MNSLFIGLGGAGTFALGELQKKFNEYDHISQKNSVNNFLYIDTDYSVTETYPFIKTDGDFFPLGKDVAPDEIMKLIDEPENQNDPDVIRIKEWIDKHNPGLRAPHDLNKGAAGVRMLTRMALWEKYEDIKSILKDKWNIPNVGPVERIYVVSGTAGGTGCGSAIDILFMLNEIKCETGQKLPTINLMLVMPEGYLEEYKDDDNRKTNYRLNAYGLFTELNAVLKDYWSNVSFKKNAAGEFLDEEGNVTTDKNKYVEIPNTITGKQWAKHSIRPLTDVITNDLKFIPFNLAYMFDSHTGTESIDYDIISERISSFIFGLETGSSVRSGLDSTYSNVLIDNSIGSARDPYIKAFNATGTFTIQTFEELQKRYVKDKFLYQIMVHGFVGKDSDYDDPQVSDDLLWEKLKQEISNFTTDAWNTIRPQFENADIQTIISLLITIEKKSKEKNQAFGQIFGFGTQNPVQRKYVSLCDTIREIVMERCGEWIAKYNINYARTLVDNEDLCAARAFALDTSKMKEFLPSKITQFITEYISIFTNEKKIRKNLYNAFEKYVLILVNRYLADDGVFDECRDLLDNILKETDINNFKIKNKTKLVRWEGNFIKDIMNLKNDTTRFFIDDPDTLIQGVRLSKSCEFPQKYATIVKQTFDGLPEMKYDESTPGQLLAVEQTIPWYKEKILRQIAMSDSFRPDVLVHEIETVKETFWKQAQKEASEIILKTKELKIPIDKKLEAEKTRTEVAQKLYSATETFLSNTQKKTDAVHPFQAIYLGHFGDSGAGHLLQTAIKAQNGYSDSKNKIVNDDAEYWDDRYVKVYVNMNYTIDEYEFFKHYKGQFKSYYNQNKKNWARHMPFSSIKFWNCENADIVELFNKGAEETQIQQMREQLEWNDSEQFYAFGFMTVLLNEYYKKLLTLNGSKEFLLKFQPLVKGKNKIKPINIDSKNKITLTYSSDYMDNPVRETYRVDDEYGVVNINLNLKNIEHLVGDIHDNYNRYVFYWIKVIQEALQKQPVSNKKSLFQIAYNKIYEIANARKETTLFRQWAEPYYNAGNQTLGERDFLNEYMLWFKK